MNNRLLDALDLLKMLEVVFEQRQTIEASSQPSKKIKDNAFPWSGIRLTLRQSRELLEEVQLSIQASQDSRPMQMASTLDSFSFQNVTSPEHPQSTRVSKSEQSDFGDKNYRGTFNRIQLTQDLQNTGSEELVAP